MSPITARSAGGARLRAALLLVVAFVVALAVAACGGAGPSFDPSGPCTTDGSAEGAYPELEALIPTEFEGRTPNRLDSGRNCSAENLGPLASAGIAEVRFAGGTWDIGSDIALVMAVFTADGLTADMMAQWWEATARGSNRTEVTATATPDVGGAVGHRLDTKTGERIQTVVVWPADTDGQVNVVITHNLAEAKVQSAIATLDAR